MADAVAPSLPNTATAPRFTKGMKIGLGVSAALGIGLIVGGGVLLAASRRASSAAEKSVIATVVKDTVCPPDKDKCEVSVNYNDENGRAYGASVFNFPSKNNTVYRADAKYKVYYTDILKPYYKAEENHAGVAIAMLMIGALITIVIIIWVFVVMRTKPKSTV